MLFLSIGIVVVENLDVFNGSKVPLIHSLVALIVF